MIRRQNSQSVHSLIAAFVERLSQVVERKIDARTRILTAERIKIALAAPATSDHTPAKDATNPTTVAAPGRRQRLRPRVGTSRTTRVAPPASAPPSPEEERRDLEFARLRALLTPTGRDAALAGVDMLSGRGPLIVVAPAIDPLRLLEGEIRNQAHGLAQLPPARCTARIAAWAGRVRSYEETNGNRVAADLLLDKLRVLARAMDAGRVEALNGSWRTSDWLSYIRTNEALAEIPQKGGETLAESLPDRSSEPDYRDVWSQPS